MTMRNEKAKLGLTLLGLKGLGRVKAREIIKSSDTLPETVEGIEQMLINVSEQTGKKLPTINKTEIKMAMSEANDALEDCANREIEISFIEPSHDSHWKNNFLRIPNPPLVLFSLGDIEILNMPSIAIIGTREPTAIGQKMATRFAKRSVKAGFCIVSGLALGCDIAAHTGALKANGKTVAVLAHGLDRVHPKQHTRIAHEIVVNGGCLLSEYSPGTEPELGNFIDRDRLQSAASLGVIVIETSIKGGSMHTVRFAKQQNRKVGCFDHDPQYHKFKAVKGNRQLLDEGEYKIQSEEDLEQFLDLCSESGKSIDKKEAQQEDLFA